MSEAISLVDELIEEFKSPGEFDVVLPSGRKLKFKAIGSHAEYVQFCSRCEMFAKAAGHKAEDGPWAGLVPIPPDTASKVFTVSELSVEPKLSQVETLKIAKQAPFLLEQLFQEIEINRCVFTQKKALEALEQGKADLSLNQIMNSDSFSVEQSTENTQTP